MGRNAKITIDNQTGYDLTFIGDDVEHGKFNENPPEKISKGSSESFEVGNHTGAKIGPKGTVTYNVDGFSNPEIQQLKLVFFWNHPFSASTSVYTASSEPNGHCSYDLRPAHPSGHDQNVTLVVSLVNV